MATRRTAPGSQPFVGVDALKHADHLKAEKAARNPDLDAKLVWRGKDAQDWTDLVVNAPPLYVQE